MELLGLDGRDLSGDIRKEVEGDRLRRFLRGTDAFARLVEVFFEELN